MRTSQNAGTSQDAEEAILAAVSSGRIAAATTLFRVLTGDLPIGDPINQSPSTLLVSTFYTLGRDERSIFRESLGDILTRSAENRSMSNEELSAALYVAFEIDLFQRREADSRSALLAILTAAVASSRDTERAALALKYLSAARLVLRIDQWHDIYRKCGTDHLLACFMGMAQVSLPEAISWLSETGSGSQLQLVLDYSIPALVSSEGGVDRVRTCLRRIQPDLNPDYFANLAGAYARAIGIAEGRIELWTRREFSPRPIPPVDSQAVRDAAFGDDPELPARWDEAISNAVPAEVVSLYSLENV